jgi:hypothetical protein
MTTNLIDVDNGKVRFNASFHILLVAIFITNYGVEVSGSS